MAQLKGYKKRQNVNKTNAMNVWILQEIDQILNFGLLSMFGKRILPLRKLETEVKL